MNIKTLERAIQRLNKKSAKKSTSDAGPKEPHVYKSFYKHRYDDTRAREAALAEEHPPGPVKHLPVPDVEREPIDWVRFMAIMSCMIDPQVGDIVRTKKYAQPLEVLKVDPVKREVGTKQASNPLPNVTETHKFTEVQPYKKEG